MTKRIITYALAIVLAFSISLSAFTCFAASESELRSAVMSTASGEVGYAGTSTTSKYGDWYGYQGSWCTTFVLWCFNTAGNNTGIKMYSKIVPSGGNCNSMISWYTDKGLYHKKSSGYSPKSGDLVFFDWSGNGSSQHVGFVDYVSGSTVYTVEGNCSGKVKARKYTSTGSKPYNNVSAIMGYASPSYSSVANSKATTTMKVTTTKKATTKKATTKKATTKKATTKKATTTKKSTTKKATTKKETTTQKPTTASTAVSSTESTTAEVKAKKLSLYAPTNTLQIGDSVDLSYTISPEDAAAVVGYFCDEEGIISIGDAGNITAIGTGTATVVVCANDELYSQYDFTVENVTNDVTVQAENTTYKIVENADENQSSIYDKKDTKTTLTTLGINVDALSENKDLYIIPASIAGATLVISLITYAIKKARNNHR